MRISDWSSDVCSSDLREELALADLHGNLVEGGELAEPPGHAVDLDDGPVVQRSPPLAPTRLAARRRIASATDSRTKEATSSTLPKIGRASCRERVCQVRVDIGGCRIIKKKKTIKAHPDQYT